MVGSMSRRESLLPINSTAFEKDLEQAGIEANDLGEFDLAIINDPYRCPPSMLRWLDYTRHVEIFEDEWPDQKKREVIAGYPAVHMIKGSIKSVRDVVRFAGYGEITIKTRGFKWFYNGVRKYNGTIKYGEASDLGWAQYIITMQTQITTRQAQIIKALINATAPARCELIKIDYQIAIKYDGQHKYDGQFKYGVN